MDYKYEVEKRAMLVSPVGTWLITAAAAAAVCHSRNCLIADATVDQDSPGADLAMTTRMVKGKHSAQ